MAAHPEEQDAGKTAVIPLGLGVVMLTSAGLWVWPMDFAA